MDVTFQDRESREPLHRVVLRAVVLRVPAALRVSVVLQVLVVLRVLVVLPVRVRVAARVAEEVRPRIALITNNTAEH